MSFTRTSLPPVVRLGGSTDVAVGSTMSHTSTTATTVALRPVVLRIPQPPSMELGPVSEERPPDKRERMARNRLAED